MNRILLALAILLFWSIPAEAQCAMCRAVLESEETQNAARGVNNGIVYLMGIPYVLMAGIGYAVYRSRKKAREDKN